MIILFSYSRLLCVWLHLLGSATRVENEFAVIPTFEICTVPPKESENHRHTFWGDTLSGLSWDVHKFIYDPCAIILCILSLDLNPLARLERPFYHNRDFSHVSRGRKLKCKLPKSVGDKWSPDSGSVFRDVRCNPVTMAN